MASVMAGFPFYLSCNIAVGLECAYLFLKVQGQQEFMTCEVVEHFILLLRLFVGQLRTCLCVSEKTYAPGQSRDARKKIPSLRRPEARSRLRHWSRGFLKAGRYVAHRDRNGQCWANMLYLAAKPILTAL